MASNIPKNRLALVTPGIGKLASALMFLLIGLISLAFNRSVGQSLLVLAVVFGIWGAYTIHRGINAPHKNVACPHCGHRNEVLAKVREFTCVSCSTPIKLVRK